MRCIDQQYFVSLLKLVLVRAVNLINEREEYRLKERTIFCCHFYQYLIHTSFCWCVSLLHNVNVLLLMMYGLCRECRIWRSEELYIVTWLLETFSVFTASFDLLTHRVAVAGSK